MANDDKNDDKTGKRVVTREEAKTGVKLQAGRPAVVVLSNVNAPADEEEDAEVSLEFDPQVVAALPGATLRLSGAGVPAQEVPLEESVQLEWKGPSRKITVEARAGSRKVVLLEAQAAGDPAQPLHWSGHLEDLVEHGPHQAAAAVTGSMGDSHLHVQVDL